MKQKILNHQLMSFLGHLNMLLFLSQLKIHFQKICPLLHLDHLDMHQKIALNDQIIFFL